MPTYTYKCYTAKKGCDHKWDEQLSINDRNNPLDGHCPKCGKKDTIIRMITATSIAGTQNAAGRFDAGKMDPVVREKLEAIKNRHDINPNTSKIDW